MEFKKRGSMIIPNEIVNVTCVCKIDEPIHKKNEKYYVVLDLQPETTRRIKEIHASSESKMTNENKIVPLNDTKLRVKVPFRYNRVTCKMPGKKTIHELHQGDRVRVNLEYCGVWSVGAYCGITWKLTLIQEM